MSDRQLQKSLLAESGGNNDDFFDIEVEIASLEQYHQCESICLAALSTVGRSRDEFAEKPQRMQTTDADGWVVLWEHVELAKFPLKRKIRYHVKGREMDPDHIHAETTNVALRMRCVELLLIPVFFAYGALVMPGHCKVSGIASKVPIVAQLLVLAAIMCWQRRAYANLKAAAPLHPAEKRLYAELDKPVKVFGISLPVSNLTWSTKSGITLYWASISTALFVGQTFDLWDSDARSRWILGWQCVPLVGSPYLGPLMGLVSIPGVLTVLLAYNWYILWTWTFYQACLAQSDLKCAEAAWNQQYRLRWLREYANHAAGSFDIANLPVMTTVFQRLYQEFIDLFKAQDPNDGTPRLRARDDRVTLWMRLSRIAGPFLLLKVWLVIVCWPSLNSPMSRFSAVQPIVLTFLGKASALPGMCGLVRFRIFSRDSRLLWRDGQILSLSICWLVLCLVQASGIFLCNSNMFGLFSGCVDTSDNST